MNKRGLREDAGRQVSEVRDSTRRRDRVDVGENLTVDEQPEGGLDRPSVELGAVVPDLAELDPAQRDDPAAQPADDGDRGVCRGKQRGPGGQARSPVVSPASAEAAGGTPGAADVTDAS